MRAARCRGGASDVYVNPVWRELLVLLRFRAVTRYIEPLFLFSRIGVFTVLAALFASFFFNQVRRFRARACCPAAEMPACLVQRSWTFGASRR